MSDSIPDPTSHEGEPKFNSLDSQIIVSDGPGDATVRPPRPLLLQLAQAERERVARLQELMRQLAVSDGPSGGRNANDSPRS